MKFSRKLAKVVTLAALKANPKLKGLVTLMPGSRLSVTPVSEAHWKEILKMGA